MWTGTTLFGRTGIKQSSSATPEIRGAVKAKSSGSRMSRRITNHYTARLLAGFVLNRSTKNLKYARRIRDARQSVGYNCSKNTGHSNNKNSTHRFYHAASYSKSEKLIPEVEGPGSISHEARWVLSVVCNEPASIAAVAAHHIPAGCIHRA